MSTRTIKRFEDLSVAQASLKEKMIAYHRKSWGDPGSKVKRTTRAVIWSAGKNRPVVVSVYPDGVVGTRLLGTQTEQYTRAEDIHRNATAAAAAAKRAAQRKARKF